jgi:Ni2+-binding GTPase involved in maturation of urease and hydrogenase
MEDVFLQFSTTFMRKPMEVLLAAPGTGKTTKIKEIIDERFHDASNILVLSFTNATINDLNDKFKEYKNVKCFTLHKYALIVNHLPESHILSEIEKCQNYRASKR